MSPAIGAAAMPLKNIFLFPGTRMFCKSKHPLPCVPTAPSIRNAKPKTMSVVGNKVVGSTPDRPRMASTKAR